MLIDVTVKVDDTRVADLYAAVIREDLTVPRRDPGPGSRLKPEPEPELEPGSGGSLVWTDADLPLATEIWQRIQPGPQKVFSVLLGAPGEKFTREKLIAETGVPGSRAFSAALTWPGKFCRNAGRKLFWSHTNGLYWIEPDVAVIFAKASSASHSG